MEEIQDTREEGLKGMAGLQSISRQAQAKAKKVPNMDIPNSEGATDRDIARAQANATMNTAPTTYIGTPELGQSRYDEDITGYSQTFDLNNTRGELQPWYDKLGAGVAKMGVLAGTTFLDGTIGVIAGLGNVITGGEDGNTEFADFWNNPISKALQSVNKWSEEALPNYYTNKEKENEANGEWYKNFFSANFLGDKIIKNFGFAIGAAYTGKLYTGLLSKAMSLDKVRSAYAAAGAMGGDAVAAATLTGELAADGVAMMKQGALNALKIKAAPWALKITGGVTGALGEAKMEAIQNSEDNMNYKKGLLDSNKEKMLQDETEYFYNNLPASERSKYFPIEIADATGKRKGIPNEEGQALIKKRTEDKYNVALKQIAEDAKDVGNMDFILNMGLLSVSNMWQFGKAYAGGYNTGRKTLGKVVKATVKDAESGLETELKHEATGLSKYAYKGLSKGQQALKVLGNPLVEGNEEMMQQAAAFASGYKYNSSDTFNKLGINAENSNQSMSVLQAMGEGMLNTYGDSSQWEQFAIGAITGLVGVPSLNIKNKQTGKLQSPMMGGIWGDIKENSEALKSEREKVDALNTRLADPKFVELYKGMTRHQTLDTAMQEAVTNSDEFEFKNAEHQQMVSDIITFHNTGRLQDYFQTLENMGAVREEDVEQIKADSINKTTGKSIFDNITNPKEVIDHVKKQTEKLVTTAESYKKIYDTLSTVYGEDFDKEVMSEMVFRMSNIDNLEKRFVEMYKGVKEGFTPFAETFKHVTYKDENGVDTPILNLLNTNPMEFLIRTTSKENNIMFNVEDAHNKDVDSLNKKAATFAGKKYIYKKAQENASNRLKELKRLVDENAELFIKLPEFSKQIGDLTKIMNLRNDFLSDHIRYTKNIPILKAKIQAEKDEVINESKSKDVQEFTTALSSATTLEEFKKIFYNPIEGVDSSEVLKELIKANNPLAVQFDKIRKFLHEFELAVMRFDNVPLNTRNEAIALFNKYANSNPNIDEITNPDFVSVAILDIEDENVNDVLNPLIYDAIKAANTSITLKAKLSVVASGEDSGTNNPVVIPVKPILPKIGVVEDKDIILSTNELNEGINKAGEQFIPEKNVVEPIRKYWVQAMHELNINKRKNKIFEDNEIANPIYANILDLLRRNNAFKYINEGNLRPKDKIGFMMNNNLTAHYDNADKLVGTIFIVTRNKEGKVQILGALDEKNAAKFEGLSEFRENTLKEYSEFLKDEANKDKNYFSKKSTTVAKIIPGSIITSPNIKNLKDVKGISKDTVFGIMQNDKIIIPNSTIPEELIVPIKQEVNREGRLYMLTKGADGKYYPVLIKTKRFNSTDFNLDDNLNKDTSVYKRIKALAIKLAEATSEEQVTAVRNLLDNDIYLADFHIKYTKEGLTIGKENTGKQDTIIPTYKDGKTPTVVKLVQVADGEPSNIIRPDNEANKRTSEEVANDILKVINDLGTYLQVDKSQLNSKGIAAIDSKLGNLTYNEQVINDDLLYSNIEDTTVKGAWFTMNYLDKEGNEQEAEDLLKVPSTPNLPVETNPITGKVETIVQKYTTVSFEGSPYYVGQTDKKIYNYLAKDKNYHEVLNMDNRKMHSILDLAWYYTGTSTNPNFKAEKSNTIKLVNAQGEEIEVYGFVTPDNNVFNLNTMTYLTKTQAIAFIKEHERLKSGGKVEVKREDTQESYEAGLERAKKIADIEKRRQADLKDIAIIDSSNVNGFNSNLYGVKSRPNEIREWNEKDAILEINKKYDAELAALDNKPTTSLGQDIQHGMNEISKGLEEGTRDQMAENITLNKTDRLIFRKPDAIEAARKNPNYNIVDNSDGSVTVIGVKNSKNVWVGKSPNETKPVTPTVAVTELIIKSSPIFEPFTGEFEDVSNDKGYPKVHAPESDRKVGVFIHPTSKKVIKTIIAPLVELYGVPIYKVAIFGNEGEDEYCAVLPNGIPIMLSNKENELGNDVTDVPKSEIIRLMGIDTVIAKAVKEDIPSISKTRNKRKVIEKETIIEKVDSTNSEMTEEEKEMLALMDKDSLVETTNTQTDNSKAHKESIKNDNKANEKANIEENKIVKSFDNTNKKLIFAELSSDTIKGLKQRGISESNFNNLTLEEQNEILKCI